jgi:hypothetical protein
MASSVLLAIGWAGWHLPAFFYIPSYTAMGLRILPAFFLGLLAGAIVLTWLYNSSGGSVLAAALWHASFNFVTSSQNTGGFVAAATSTLVMVWAIVVVWRYDWTTLSAPTVLRSVRATREEKIPVRDVQRTKLRENRPDAACGPERSKGVCLSNADDGHLRAP